MARISKNLGNVVTDMGSIVKHTGNILVEL